MFAIIVFYCAILSGAQSARILGVFMTPSYSHQVVFQPIWKELSLRGHQLTVLTPNPLNDPTLTNLTEIDLGFSYAYWNNFSIATLGTTQHSAIDEIKQLTEAYFAVSAAQLSHPPVQALLNRTNGEEFDLILVEFLWPMMYGFKAVYNCPMVGLASLGLTVSGNDALGNPSHPALDPEFSLPFSTNLSFKERVISTVFKTLFRVSARLSLRPRLERMAAEHFGEIPPLSVLSKEVSLVVVNSNLALHNVRPVVPAIVEISGIHIKPRKPLPKDLQAYLNNGKEGVIYFSLGSNIKSNSLPKHQLEMLMNAFAYLPYKILWKFENEHLPNKPENVEIRKWLPQQDILAHPNVKLFITQGGVQSLDEAIYHRVPVLAIPFFADQRYNAHHLVATGGGLSIDFHAFTEDELTEKIQTLITNPTYKKTIRKLSMIARDQPMSALEKAVWWIEYVIRHDGAPHLRYAAVDMPLYQYYLLDVMAFIGVILALIGYILRRMLHRIKLSYHYTVKALNLFQQKSHVE